MLHSNPWNTKQFFPTYSRAMLRFSSICDDRMPSKRGLHPDFELKLSLNAYLIFIHLLLAPQLSSSLLHSLSSRRISISSSSPGLFSHVASHSLPHSLSHFRSRVLCGSLADADAAEALCGWRSIARRASVLSEETRLNETRHTQNKDPALLI